MGSTFICTSQEEMNHIRFLIYLRNLNRQLKHKPYPMQKIREMSLNLESFKYALSLDLNIVYCHIRLSRHASNLCTIILPWVKYRYKRLPTGVINSSDIFQQKMNEMFRGFEFIRAYIDDLLIIRKGDCSNHLDKIKRTLQKLKDNGLKCNIL